MSDDRPPAQGDGELAEPARLTTGTLLGCVGLLCVLSTVPLLWLAVSSGSGWLSHVLPVVAFAAAIGGASLTLRVPATRVAHSHDPQRPLTPTGSAPTVERPAARANRLAWLLSAAVLLCASGGYTLEIIQPNNGLGLAIMLAAGALVLCQGALVAGGRAPVPALRWLRLSIYGETWRQGAGLMALGVITIGGALFLALLDGHAWAVVGLTVFIAAATLVAPIARRAPPRRGLPRARSTQPQRPE
ncbi:MAG TPA: hypothetical protein VF812_16940 [Ktedonobacterales bacterium]